MSCGGASIEAGRDYLVFGEVQSIDEQPFLALTHATVVDSPSYMVHVCGDSDDQGRVAGGFLIDRHGGFEGALFAVDKGRRLVVRSAGGGRLAAPEMPPSRLPSPAPAEAHSGERLEKVAASEEETFTGTISSDQGDSGRVTVVAPAAPDGDKREAALTAPPRASEPLVKIVGGDEKKEPTGGGGNLAWSRGAQDVDTSSAAGAGAGEGEGRRLKVEGADILVEQAKGLEFPESGPLPELTGVKRSELARKAEARKKTTKAAPVVGATTPSVSSSGMRLGKDSGGDNRGRVGQNKIDEDELW
jgi:hypothetical protein